MRSAPCLTRFIRAFIRLNSNPKKQPRAVLTLFPMVVVVSRQRTLLPTRSPTLPPTISKTFCKETSRDSTRRAWKPSSYRAQPTSPVRLWHRVTQASLARPRRLHKQTVQMMRFMSCPMHRDVGAPNEINTFYIHFLLFTYCVAECSVCRALVSCSTPSRQSPGLHRPCAPCRVHGGHLVD